jgi:hypothetical protein
MLLPRDLGSENFFLRSRQEKVSFGHKLDRRYFSRPAAKAVWDVSDPKWTFGASNMMIARRAESETSSLRVRLVLYASAPPPAAHRASSLSRVLASFRSSVSKPSVNQP